MKRITCEMCGSNSLVKHDGLFVCQSCQTKYTPEEARKMMIEGTVEIAGTIKVDSSEKLKNLYTDINKMRREYQKIHDDIAEEIKKYEPSYSQLKLKKSKRSRGCYIATAVYGSYNCHQVCTLRRYRDQILSQKWYGQAFISVYYFISPRLVEWFGEKQWFIRLFRHMLDNLVVMLQSNGIECSPYDDNI